MSQENGLELKVGLFVLLALLVLTFFIISMSDLSFFQKGCRYQVLFGFTSGLKDAAPVRLAGVEVGVVRSLNVFRDETDAGKTRVRVNIWIKDDIAIPMDSFITINQLGLLGEKYLEIIPGTSKDRLKQNGQITGHDPVPMEKIAQQVETVAGKVEDLIDHVNNGILTDKNKKSLEDALSALSRVGTNVQEGHGTVGRLLMDESIYNNLDEFTADLKANPWKLLYRPKTK